MTRKSILSLLFLIVTPVLAAPGPQAPFENAVKALQEGNTDDATRWFSTTHRDFPKTKEGDEALLHQTFLTVAKELSSLKLYSIWKEGASLGRFEESKAKQMLSKAKEYETRARAASDEMVKLVPDLLAMTSVAMELKFKMNTAGWDATELAERLKKGERLEDADAQKLERAEFLKSYVGFLAAVFDLPENQVLQTDYESTVKGPILFKAVGSRIYLAHQTSRDPISLQRAKDAFEKVLSLTKDVPYDRHRQEASDFLVKIQLMAGKKPLPKCPVDQEPMKTEWKYCPFHGVKLKS